MPLSKDCISLPLEAGQSLLDAKHLPPQVTDALEYVSSRLARKRLHLSLIVIPQDVQIPSFPSTQSPKLESLPPTSIRSPFASTSFKRSASKSSLSTISSSSSTSSTSSAALLSQTQWPGLPASPKDINAAPSSHRPRIPASADHCGISLMYASTLTPRTEKILRQIVAKAEKKFSIGSGWLSHPSINDLAHHSLIQNEVLLSSEGLTLLSLDHVYTFKCHLHTYSQTLDPSDLTSAVDELRRLVLAQQGRSITKIYLMRTYDWLEISLSALVDVNEGYKVAYGGIQRFGGIVVQNEERRSPPPLRTKLNDNRIGELKVLTRVSDHGSVGSTRSTGEIGGIELAARLREDKGPHFRGPATPNGFEDLTPVTRGEWSFLKVGEGWNTAKIAAIETC